MNKSATLCLDMVGFIIVIILCLLIAIACLYGLASSQQPSNPLLGIQNK